MKYYVSEHLHAYQRIAFDGMHSWDELHGSQGFEDATIRHCLSVALPQYPGPKRSLRALEYGCGTGPGACYLAERGFQVTGVDLNPLAIEIARKESARRGLNIHYVVGDVCVADELGFARFDLILDSFCLQSIVTDQDRSALFRFVKRHLQPNGYYLICTAGFSASRGYAQAHFDPQSGTVYVAREDEVDIEDVIEIGGALFMPYRRHLRVEQLTSELAAFGITVIWQQVDTHGNMVLLCKVA